MNTPQPFDANTWEAVKTLYEQALALPSGERGAFVAAAATADAVREQVLSLLAHENDTTDAGLGLLGPSAAMALLGRQDRVGQRLGAWEIVRALGAGGMGEVFEARRADGSFEGRAAIKLLKRGMDSAVVLQRFAQERQALARLKHPHIATLLDAGLSADGVPYFVMELVNGKPIDEAVVGLSVESRLALFLQLADAVAYAHRNLLVHRDLKPGNVLVTPEGDVKLLDFGIAKALEPLDSAHGAGDTTLGASRPFTPNYASPEQVRGEPVNTSTDIYSLGVLLYQLLTGVRPTGRTATNWAEAALSVLEETPLRPSSLSPAQVLDSRWLETRKHLQGDLDNILLKALEKLPERRYASAEAFGADIRAYLGGFPVSARRRSKRYVFARFVARHRWGVAAASGAGLAVLAGLGGTLWQAHEAQLAKAEAEQRLAETRNIVHELVFRFGDSIAYLPGGMSVKEDLLKDTLKQVQRMADASNGDPVVLGDVVALHGRLAELQGSENTASTGQFDQARAHADQAIALGAQIWAARKADRPFANWVLRAYEVRAKLKRSEGQLEKALQDLATARALAEESLALQTSDLERAWLLADLANQLFIESQILDSIQPSLNQPTEALQKSREAEDAFKRLLAMGDKVLDALDATGRPEEPKTKAALLANLASAQEGRALIHMKQDEPELGLADAETAAQTQEQVLALDPLQTLWRDGAMRKYNTLAVIHIRLGQTQPAMLAAQRSWDEAQALVKSEGAQSVWAQALPTLAQQYGRALAGVGRHTEAVPVFEQSIAAWAAQAKAGPNANAQRRLGWIRTHLSRSQFALGKRSLALSLAQEAASGLRETSLKFAEKRDVWLSLGEALAWQAEVEPAQADKLRAEARAAYDRAAGFSPLKAEFAAARAALG